MEDPWATGPSWGSTSTPKTPPTMQLPAELTSPRRKYEDDADPWAVPSTPSVPPPAQLEAPPRSPSPPRMPTWGAAGGDSGWGASSPVAPTTSPPRESPQGDAAPVWKLDSPPLPPQDPSPPSGIPIPHTPDRSIPTSPAAEALRTPQASFSPAIPHKSPFANTDVLESFGTPKRSSLNASPDFGAFGGFEETAFPSTSAGAWGGADDPWSAGPSSAAWGAAPEHDESVTSPRADQNDDEEEGWAGVASKTVVEPAKSGMDEEWEVAQARMRVLADRAPPERVDQLRSDWKELVGSVIGLHKLEGLTSDEEDRLEAAVRKIASESEEALRSLTAIPPDTNTYPPVLSSLETHRTYLSQLTRPNPTPSTSLFTLPAQRARRTELSSENAWTSRSRLGEPDVPKDVAADEPAKSKWSFWGRRAPAAPLVTSGGGVLEVKPAIPSAPLTPAPATERPSMSSRSVSIVSGQPSRPASPAVEEGQLPGETAAAGPSGLGRFFGRLRKASTPANGDVDAKDMELTDDDFGFLAEVPSIAPPDRAMGDLLSLDPGRDAGSLESVLSKPPPLPALAPPPRPGSGGKFVARMANPAAAVSDMDLLGGLDFDGEPPKTSSTSAWEDFLVPSSSPPPPAVRSTSPPVQAPLQGLAAPPRISSPLTAPPAGPRPIAASNFNSDFADFTIAPSSFDDFGDFDNFAPVAANGTTPKVSVKPSSLKLDQSNAMSLVNDAIASKGKRWPAPPSPNAPILEPPPKAAPSSAGFPFLSPPPPGRGSKPNDLMAEAAQAPPSASAFAGTLAPPMQAAGSGSSLAPSLLAPSRSATPAAPRAPSAGMDKKQGLSAQDLSFFDSL